MSVKGMFCLIAVIFTALAIVSCSNKGKANSSAKDTPVVLELKIGGCACEQYTEFNITWDKKDSPKVNSYALMGVLMETDRNGALLCDCSHGKGEKYTSVVKSIESLPDKKGVKVILTQKVYLDRDDVVPHMENVLKELRREVFYGNQFEIG